MPRLFAAAPASTLRPVVSPNCSLITFNNCRLFSSTLTSQHPTPPGPALCALLRLYPIGGNPSAATRKPLEGILVRLVGIHRGFIARSYRRGCPAVGP